MLPYHIYLHGRVYDVLAKLGHSERNGLLNFFQRVSGDPFQPHDYRETVEGFDVSVKVIGRHAGLYHVDHAGKEVKITDLRLADHV